MATKTKSTQAKADVSRAISNPLRSKILVLLIDRTASPMEMSKLFGEPVGKVSYHVKKLREWGCVELVGEKKRRGAMEHFYRATERVLVDLTHWEQLDPMVREHTVAQTLQNQIDDATAAAGAHFFTRPDDLHVTRMPLLLDEEGQREMLEIHERALKETMDVQARSAQRRAGSGDPGTPYSSSQSFFEMPST